MISEQFIRLPAACRQLSPAESDAVFGGAESTSKTNDTSGLGSMLSSVEKISKVFNYMARIFSATSSMLNNLITIYNTMTQLNEYIDKNF